MVPQLAQTPFARKTLMAERGINRLSETGFK